MLHLDVGDIIGKNIKGVDYECRVINANSLLELYAKETQARRFQAERLAERGEDPEEASPGITADDLLFYEEMAGKVVVKPESLSVTDLGHGFWKWQLLPLIQWTSGLEHVSLQDLGVDLEEITVLPAGETISLNVGPVYFTFKMPAMAQGEMLSSLVPGTQKDLLRAWKKYVNKLFGACVVNPNWEEWGDWPGPRFGVALDLLILFAGAGGDRSPFPSDATIIRSNGKALSKTGKGKLGNKQASSDQPAIGRDESAPRKNP